MVGKYEKAIKPHIERFKEQIKNNSDGIISVKLKDVARVMGKEFENKHVVTIYSRLRDILLEHGIKVVMNHHYGCNLMMSFADKDKIISAADARYKRGIATAKNQGKTFTEYMNECNQRNTYVGTQSGNSECPLYFGEYIEKKFIPKIFEGFIPYVFPKDDMGRITDVRKPYDYISKQGFKIKHVASCIHERKSQKSGECPRRYWQWLIRRNDIPDYWVLSGWNNRDSIEPMYVWVIYSDESVETQILEMKDIPFYDRDSFTVFFNEKGIKKMKKFELDILKDIEITCSNINIRAELVEWYLTYFR